MSKSSQYQFLISVAGWPGYFVSRTGGDTQANVQKVYDGGSLHPDLVAGRPVTNNVVGMRHFDTTRDGPIRKRYLPLVGQWRTTVTVQPCDANLVPTGDPDVYAGALLSRLGAPGANAQSDDPSEYEVEFTVASVT
jgi:hypothetical protein